jgi:protein TonB
MEQPFHAVRIARPSTQNRTVALIIVAIIHAGLIYALAEGLRTGALQKGLQEIKVAVEKPKLEKLPPPPPPPDLAKPPPPVVPPPEIVIQQPAPAAVIHVVTKPPPVAAPKISSPVGIGRPHYCDPNRYYSENAIRLQEAGTTILSFTITADGDVQSPTVATSSGFDDLDQAAVRCASGWRYKPAIQDNNPVAVNGYKASIVWKIPK